MRIARMIIIDGMDEREERKVGEKADEVKVGFPNCSGCD